MIKKALFTLMLLIGCSAFAATGSDSQTTAKHKQSAVNLGVKGGFNSTMLFADHFTIGGIKVSKAQNNYKVGYFVSFFLRANFKRHFIQPEISYNINKASVFLSAQPDNEALLAENALIINKMSSVDFPLLYGYKFINKHPYGMTLFVGPKIAWIWDKHTHMEYSGFHQLGITEKIRPWNYSAVFGISVNISNIFCDFRYEIGANNLSESIEYDHEATPSPYNECEMVFKRRRNVLSFSLGVIF